MGIVPLSTEPFRQSPEPLAALQFLLVEWKAISLAGEAEDSLVAPDA